MVSRAGQTKCINRYLSSIDSPSAFWPNEPCNLSPPMSRTMQPRRSFPLTRSQIFSLTLACMHAMPSVGQRALTTPSILVPLKRKTPLCTFVGAFPGAAPPLIGWVAASGSLSLEAWLLYSMLFLWQFPHFMAIAWMYREDYSRAGYQVLRRAGTGADSSHFKLLFRHCSWCRSV
jgi:hypothetical protein